jgi:hypothetical protein
VLCDLVLLFTYATVLASVVSVVHAAVAAVVAIAVVSPDGVPQLKMGGRSIGYEKETLASKGFIKLMVETNVRV